MKWILISKENELPKPGEYVVKTLTTFLKKQHVLQCTLSYDSKGNPKWSCNNQIVTHWLNEEID